MYTKNLFYKLQITIGDTQEDKLKQTKDQEILLAEIQNKVQGLTPELSYESYWRTLKQTF